MMKRHFGVNAQSIMTSSTSLTGVAAIDRLQPDLIRPGGEKEPKMMTGPTMSAPFGRWVDGYRGQYRHPCPKAKVI